jgi:hypothetical protein
VPRPISWLPRLPQLRRAVEVSVRSHWSRSDLERLFELQPRAAQKLLELLPTVQVGTSHLVERDTLTGFLEGVAKSEDTSSYFQQLRRERVAVSHQKLRHLVPRDLEPVRLASLPPTVHLDRGSLEVTFTTIEELAISLYALARAIEAEGEEMARRYETAPTPTPVSHDEGIEVMFAELEQLERAYRERKRKTN